MNNNKIQRQKNKIINAIKSRHLFYRINFPLVLRLVSIETRMKLNSHKGADLLMPGKGIKESNFKWFNC